ncbi:MAG: TonB-dependent receptor plug domain-containing protein [Methylococcales bacterium]|nr:TonB-dependent receptor [Methylococcaceae bacterium]
MKSGIQDAFIEVSGRQQLVPSSVSLRKTLSVYVAAIVVGSSILAAQEVSAATKKSTKNKTQTSKAANELAAENALLRAQLEAVQKERDQLKNASVAPAAGAIPGAASAEPSVAAAESAETVAETESANTDNLGEVVVRAKPKLEKLHEVKQSVSVVSGKELDRELALDLGAITRRASNVSFNQENTRGASLSIRGVGKRSFTETQDPSVGVTVDGVSYGLSQLANFSFYDVDSVEVTRGPRGTEGGLSASAGKVNVVSKAPSFTPTAELAATYGEREAMILKGALGGGVIDDLLAWRGSFIVDKGRGFYSQEYDSNYSQYNRDRLSGRVQFLLTPTSNLKAKISADFEPKQPQLQNGLDFYHKAPQRFLDGTLVDPNGTQAYAKLAGFRNKDGVFTGPRDYFKGRGFSWEQYSGGERRNTVWYDENKGQTVSNQGASVQVDWDVADHVLSSNTAVREYSFDAHNDEGTPYNISVDGGGGVNYGQFTQEFKIKNNPGGFVDYKAGVFGMKTHDDIDSKAGWGSDAGAWFATNGQYNTLERNAGVNRGAGLALLKDSLQDARRKGTTEVNTLSGSLFGESDLHFTDAFTLTSGLRTTLENRKTRNTIGMTNYGVGGFLNPVEIRGVQLGGFNSAANSTADPAFKTGDLLAGNTEAQLKMADKVAARYFGKTLAAGQVAGDAYKGLTAAQRAMIGTAKNVRNNQIGQLYQPVESAYDDLLFTAQLTPSYKFSEDLTGYLAWQYGEKSGSALNVNGVSRNVKPENTHALELGFKSFWLDKAIIVNVDAFVMDIHNYQQTISVVNEYQTAINISNGQANPTAYTTAQGNVKKVRVHGVELDSTFNVIQNLSLRFNGAYNIGRYIDYNNAPKPDELAFLKDPYMDFSNKTLPGANKWSFVVGAEYTKPVFEKYNFHTSFNTNFVSGSNSSDTLSAYGNINAKALTDAAIGIGTKNNALDFSFIVKNLFNNNAHAEGWNSYGPNPYPAWFGVQLSGKI